MIAMTLNLEEDDAYIADYIKENNIDTSNLTVDQFLEIIEDAKDLYELRKAKAEDDGTRFSMEDVAKELGFAL